jgi:hypothetical protein
MSGAIRDVRRCCLRDGVGMEGPSEAVVAALAALLAETLTTNLTAAGWSVDLARQLRPAGHDLPSFRHPVEGGFTATVEFMLVGSWEAGDPPVAHASIEQMLEEARSDPELFYLEIEQAPLLLAAAGRHDEARDALARYQASDDWSVAQPEYRRFARQLTL